MRKLAVLVLVAMTTLAAAPKKAPPASVAPPALTHPIAMFLDNLSKDGARQVTFRATAVGTRFFFEESAGVTVYRFEKGGYVKEAFLRDVKLAAAVKRYAK